MFYNYKMSYNDRLPLNRKELVEQYSSSSSTDYDTIERCSESTVEPCDAGYTVFRLERFAQIMDCPNCKMRVYTHLQHKTGMWTWCTCLLMVVYGCVGCCFIPFCTDCVKDVYHTCPKCKFVIGVVKPV
jgi:lipopolysaccharide-induced tumor necrosis factor-alpha factor